MSKTSVLLVLLLAAAVETGRIRRDAASVAAQKAITMTRFKNLVTTFITDSQLSGVRLYLVVKGKK